MASYSTMNTVPAADVESETPVLSRDIKVNAKALLGGAAVTRNRAAASTSIGRSKRIDRSEKQQKIWKASPSS